VMKEINGTDIIRNPIKVNNFPIFPRNPIILICDKNKYYTFCTELKNYKI
jgi:hypothetical protein